MAYVENEIQAHPERNSPKITFEVIVESALQDIFLAREIQYKGFPIQFLARFQINRLNRNLEELRSHLQAGQYYSILRVINEELALYLVKMESSQLKQSYMAKKVEFLVYLRCFVHEKILQCPAFQAERNKARIETEFIIADTDMRRITHDEIFTFRDLPDKRKIAKLARELQALRQLENGPVDETLDLETKV